MDTPTIIGALMALLAALIVYAIFVPKSSRRFSPSDDRGVSKSPILKLVATLGDDIYASLPASFDNRPVKKNNHRIESLIVRSGNPWNLTAEEFVAFRFVSAFLGFLVAWPVWLLVYQLKEVPWFLIVPLVVLFAYNIPTSKYKDQAKKRDLEFKRQLPEALDLMTISISGGTTFANALRDVVPTMQDGILKIEFINITRVLDAGGTLKEALDQFAERAPNDGVMTFIRSVQSATEVNAPLAEILESRAQASREEFFALIHQKTAQLESKIWMILSPTLIPAVIIIAVAPSVSTMISSMG